MEALEQRQLLSLTEVTDTFSYPFTAVAEIHVQFPDGRSFVGSGAVIDSDHVLTAAHLLYHAQDGGWARSITVNAGLNGSGYYAQAGWKRATIYTAYKKHDDVDPQDYSMAGDLGLVQLDRPLSTGTFGYASNPANFYTGLAAYSAGYPSQYGYDGTHQWKTNGGILGEYVDSTGWRLLDWQNYGYNDNRGLSLFIGGQSGSPVYYKNDQGNRYICGVYIASSSPDNAKGYASEITGEVFHDIQNWVTADHSGGTGGGDGRGIVGRSAEGGGGGSHPPVLSTLSDQTVQEGSTLTFLAGATSPDGKPLTFTLDAGAPAGAGINPYTGVFTWTPTVPGTYHLTVRVTDTSSPPLSDTKTFTVTVTDAPLVATGNTLQAIQEGTAWSGVLASFTDADPNAKVGDYTITIAWGDGQTSTGTIKSTQASNFEISGQHTYASAGSFKITVSIDDSEGASARVESTATVADAALTAVPTNDVVTQQGASGSILVATFVDSGGALPAGNYTSSINWGDGTTSAGTVSGTGPNNLGVYGSHLYSGEGRYSLTVTINDAGGSTATSTSTIHVARQGPPPAALLQVANALTHSAEYYANLVTTAYQQYLKRTPDPDGLAGWVRNMQKGFSDERLEAAFIGSQEYILTHGGTGEAWVIGLYRDLLGRNPDDAGLQSWLRNLKAGMDPAQIAFGFAASQEREAQRITADYGKYLGREPEPGIVPVWVNSFVHGASNENVIAGFVGATEYFLTHYNNARDWLFAAYQQALGRTPTQADYDQWLPLLKT